MLNIVGVMYLQNDPSLFNANLLPELQALSGAGNGDAPLSNSSIHNNVIFSEDFEGTVKIIKNESISPIDENESLRRVNYSDLIVETVFTGIGYTSNMAFIGPDDILFLEKNDGTVNRITNGVLLNKPLLDLNVVHSDGLLGIAVSKNETGHTYVFLYFTESLKEYAADKTDNGGKIGNGTIGQEKVYNSWLRSRQQVYNKMRYMVMIYESYINNDNHIINYR